MKSFKLTTEPTSPADNVAITDTSFELTKDTYAPWRMALLLMTYVIIVVAIGWSLYVSMDAHRGLVWSDAIFLLFPAAIIFDFLSSRNDIVYAKWGSTMVTIRRKPDAASGSQGESIPLQPDTKMAVGYWNRKGHVTISVDFTDVSGRDHKLTFKSKYFGNTALRNMEQWLKTRYKSQ